MPKTPLTTLIAAVCALALFASSAAAAPAEFAGSSADGSKVFFTTAAKLVPGDTDNGFVDVYERFYDGAPGIETYVTREISTGPTGGNDSYDVTFGAVSSDGEKVFFSTAESLVAEDKDKSRDVYERNTATGETILLSGGPASCAPCGNRETSATFVGATPSGSKVFFTTDEKLAENDTDEAGDVYVRDPNEAAAVLATPGGTSPVTFQGASADGTKVVFETADKLELSDTDEETDIYERDISAGTTKLVSGGACPLPPAECIPLYRATAADGSVLLQTKAQLSLEDKDTSQDVYDWSPASGTATLVSTGAEGEEGAGAHHAEFAGIAASGSKVFFETDESLSALDTDESNDVYERSSGSTTLISGGSAHLPAFFNGSSADGSTVIFSTREALGGGDSGEKLDGYERTGGTTTLVTPGSAEFDGTVVGHSSDASAVFYTTSQKLAAADADSNPDIYEWPGGGAPALISTGPAGGNGSFTPHFVAASDDASHVFFTTQERLTVDDNFS
ncbi:MAG: TolB family protein, partial [Solirubrobacterales bacterium]